MPGKSPPGNIIGIAAGAIALASVALFFSFLFWAMNEPFMEKEDKLISEIVNCDTEGVVCK